MSRPRLLDSERLLNRFTPSLDAKTSKRSQATVKAVVASSQEGSSCGVIKLYKHHRRVDSGERFEPSLALSIWTTSSIGGHTFMHDGGGGSVSLQMEENENARC